MGLSDFASRTADGLTDRLVRRRRVRTCMVRGQAIRLDVESPIERFRARTYATKEPETLDWLQQFLEKGEVFYDVGANIGLYTLFAAKCLDGTGRVYAFEPEALNYAKLNQNIYLNHLSACVVPCCLALSDRPQFDVFHLNPAASGDGAARDRLVSGSAMHSFAVAEDFRGQPFEPVHRQGMLGLPIDDLWATWGFSFPNHIKIDVDGVEHDVIAGARRTLEDPRLRSILIEFSDRSAHATFISGRLAETGFGEWTGFSAHSSEQMKGTVYEDARNRVFVRSRSASGRAE